MEPALSDPAALARLLAQLSGDLVLVLDAKGCIQAMAAGPDTPVELAAASWQGRDWAETVSPESRHKVARILQEVVANGRARRRELNHPLPDGGCSAWAYHAVRIDAGPTTLALGRDLREQSALQQRLLQAQREVEAWGWPSQQ